MTSPHPVENVRDIAHRLIDCVPDAGAFPLSVGVAGNSAARVTDSWARRQGGSRKACGCEVTRAARLFARPASNSREHLPSWSSLRESIPLCHAVRLGMSGGHIARLSRPVQHAVSWPPSPSAQPVPGLDRGIGGCTGSGVSSAK